MQVNPLIMEIFNNYKKNKFVKTKFEGDFKYDPKRITLHNGCSKPFKTSY